MNTTHWKDTRTRELLEAIDQQSDVTQRGLADRLGVALGLTNSYLRRCARKGWIKIKQVPPNRYLYYLTPKGFSEKSRLTARYLSDSLGVYRRASESYAAIFRAGAADGGRRAILCGASELAEIACIRAPAYGVEVCGIYDPDCRQRTFLHYPVWTQAAQLPACDLMVLTALWPAERIARELGPATRWPAPLRIPDFLSVTPQPPPPEARNAERAS
jgi:DNA-binding MarR family transcriptional regulator